MTRQPNEQTDMAPIRLILVEDDPDWVTAMSAFLGREPDFVLTGTAANAADAIELAQTADFDVVLMDIHLSGDRLDGIYAAADIAELRPQAKIIMLTSLQDESIIRDSFTAGAIHYVPKSDYRQLPQAIRSAYHHAYPMEVLLKEFARLKREEQLKPLTPAEREVLELIGQGYTQAQIERKLYKSESTIKNQVNKILKKLGVKSSKEAVQKVRRKGLFRK